MLEIKGLSKSFAGVQAVNEVSFTVEKGKCSALLGPNGAGKTTTLRMITGLLKPDRGVARFTNGVHDTASLEYREQIGYLPQMPSFYGWMSGLEFAIYAGKLCGMKQKEAEKRAKELLAKAGLEQAAKRRIGGYSGGMKQRLGLVQALMHHPKLLVMDEPVSALDPIGRREVLTLLQELKNETAILFSTHVLPDAEELCDHIFIMRKGEIALQGSLQQIQDKYKQSIIDIQLAQRNDVPAHIATFLQAVKTLPVLNNGVPTAEPLFEQAEAEEKHIRLTVKDGRLEEAGQQVLALLAEKQISIEKLEIGHSTLEQLFMKAVTE